MTGAQVFARACKAEGVAALFCCPGNYSVVHAISDTGIPTYGGRHEGAQCHAADAFTRVTGEIAATSGTEGPGFTDMICGIAAANSARSPVWCSPATRRSSPRIPNAASRTPISSRRPRACGSTESG
jgi:thiamine pyrophosphate-dependent acetolactate synthase large subunit-like protein